MSYLPINLDTFGFVIREKRNGLSVKYKCGRDFLYYALHYYFPKKFNQGCNNPVEIETKRLFGSPVPAYFSWTQIQFYKLPRFLKENSLTLKINKQMIESFSDFVRAILFSRISHDEAVDIIERGVSKGNVVGVDIALRFEGLEDHVLFVYGFDEKDFYVFDTHKVPLLKYEKITDDDRYVMRLSRDEVRKRWKIFSRVWEVNLI